MFEFPNASGMLVAFENIIYEILFFSHLKTFKTWGWFLSKTANSSVSTCVKNKKNIDHCQQSHM